MANKCLAAGRYSLPCIKDTQTILVACLFNPLPLTGKHITKPWKLINLICCSVRVAKDNRAPVGRGGASTRAGHAKLYGRGGPTADC